VPIYVSGLHHCKNLTFKIEYHKGTANADALFHYQGDANQPQPVAATTIHMDMTDLKQTQIADQQ